MRTTTRGLLLIGALAGLGGALAQPAAVGAGDRPKAAGVRKGAKSAKIGKAAGVGKGAKSARGERPEGGKLANFKSMPWRAAYASKQWRNALPGLRQALASNPDDPELHAYYAMASARIGRFSDALPSFGYAEGADIYERDGLSLHADSLRATGHAAEAVQLRREAFLMAARVPTQFNLAFDLVDDLRMAGDLQAAEDAAWAVLSEAPGLEESYALLADVALDAGDLDEAALQLWYADLYGHRTSRTRAARARLQLAYGDLDEALAEVNYGRMRGRNHMPIAIQGEVLRRMGQADSCLARLDAGTVPDKERPEIVAVKVACLASDGQLDEAEELRAWVIEAYPRDPNVLAASTVLDEALAKAGRD